MTKKIIKICAGIIMGLSLTVSAGALAVNAGNTPDESGTADMYSGADDSILNIASVSKMYVTAAVMQLVDSGKVELDTAVADYITDFKMADERYMDITVRMLMNHTSGLMGSTYAGALLFDEKSRDYHNTFLQKLKRQHLKADPGAFNCYCNDGFTLLEILVERVSGLSFTEYMKENISIPLSLEHTGTLWDMDTDRQIPVYINGNVKLNPVVPQLIGAGGILSDAEDVCRFGTAFFTGNNILLSEKAKCEMAENNSVDGCLPAFGLGWDNVEKDEYKKAGVNLLSKGGDALHHSNLLVAPDEKISVAVLSSGGSSTNCEEICLELMDVALSEQGINIVHPEKERPELLTVPDEYLKYEGLYANTEMTMSISFPDKQCMLARSVTAEKEFEAQYMYTADGTFVEMSGDVSSGNAIPVQPVQAYLFEEKNGQIYLSHPEMGCMLVKLPEKQTDERMQKAWDERSGLYYYLVNGSYSDSSYTDNNRLKLCTSREAPGMVNGYRIQDEDHAGYDPIMPGSASRDISDLRMERINGKEYACLDDLGFKLISENDIPVFSNDVRSVELTSGEAGWYKIDGIKDVTIRLDIPQNAAVYVYDKYMNIKYSSYMSGYGYSIPLPECGMIVFIGESGSSVNISR
ncbi:MAG: beta-lactamase family protein [Lachnospiraceae bacterium]|nr:beta-lactamase family protein [Lachnospiraceae bacterium]